MPPEPNREPHQPSNGDDDHRKLNATPFARVITTFMWSQQPPWSATKTAAVLGLGRARVAKWVYQGAEPELSTMMSVMAKLEIPIRLLLDAYAEAGLPVPPLDTQQASGQAEAAKTTSPAQQTQPAKPQMSAEEAERREWETMFAHTRKVMAAAGMPAAAVDAMIAELEQRRLGKPTPAQRRIAEEMQPDSDDADDPQDADAHTTRSHIPGH